MSRLLTSGSWRGMEDSWTCAELYTYPGVWPRGREGVRGGWVVGGGGGGERPHLGGHAGGGHLGGDGQGAASKRLAPVSLAVRVEQFVLKGRVS